MPDTTVLDDATYKLCEAVFDISCTIACHIACNEVKEQDSRQWAQMAISWAQDFQHQRQLSGHDSDEYMDDIDEFIFDALLLGGHFTIEFVDTIPEETLAQYDNLPYFEDSLARISHTLN